jgi:hypothetical protein
MVKCEPRQILPGTGRVTRRTLVEASAQTPERPVHLALRAHSMSRSPCLPDRAESCGARFTWTFPFRGGPV